MEQNIQKSMQTQKQFLGITTSTDKIKATASELLLDSKASITDKEVIERYGKRLKELCQQSEPKIKNVQLAEAVGVTSQAIGDIMAGKPKSVNPELCNKFAVYFQCSAYYLLGFTEDKQGVLVDGEKCKIPFIQGKDKSHVNIIQAGHWAELDPDLFQLLEKVFYLDSRKRDAIKVILEAMVK